VAQGVSFVSVESLGAVRAWSCDRIMCRRVGIKFDESGPVHGKQAASGVVIPPHTPLYFTRYIKRRTEQGRGGLCVAAYTTEFLECSLSHVCFPELAAGAILTQSR
jgi:hypothetical protein